MTDLTCATVEKSNGIAEVTLSAKGKANLMGPDYWAQMPTLFAGLDADESIRVIIIRGSGAHFSFGLDLMGMVAELMPLVATDAGAKQRRELLDLIRRMQMAHTAVARCRKPVIAAINGWCIGGAIDLITACDVRLASADAKFSIRETRMAMVADVGTLARLPAIVGQGIARELAFTGDDFEAQRALDMGLVNSVHANTDELMKAARSLAARMAKNSPFAVQGVKEILNAASEKAAAENLETVALWNAAFFASKDLHEAIGAFMEKREPTFTGE